jgi:hypothetical protein
MTPKNAIVPKKKSSFIITIATTTATITITTLST